MTCDKVWQHVDIVKLIGEEVRLLKMGEVHIGLCPFNRDCGESFIVSRNKGRFLCFNCQSQGNVLDYISQLEGITEDLAFKFLMARCGAYELTDEDHKEFERQYRISHKRERANGKR